MSLFLLWWAWLAFNAGCSYGVTGGKWEYAVRAGINTALFSWGGGAASILFSMARHKGTVDIFEVVSGVLSALGKF
jgi:ammonia channel protein AmtB